MAAQTVKRKKATAAQILERSDLAWPLSGWKSHDSTEVGDIFIGLLLITFGLGVAAAPFLIIALADLRIAAGFVFGALGMAGVSFIERGFTSRDKSEPPGKSNAGSSSRSSEPPEESQVSAKAENRSTASSSTDP